VPFGGGVVLEGVKDLKHKSAQESIESETDHHQACVVDWL